MRLQSEDYGKHLMGVEDLLQKHSLLESDIAIVGSRVKTINAQAQYFVDAEFAEVQGLFAFKSLFLSFLLLSQLLLMLLCLSCQVLHFTLCHVCKTITLLYIECSSIKLLNKCVID